MRRSPRARRVLSAFAAAEDAGRGDPRRAVVVVVGRPRRPERRFDAVLERSGRAQRREPAPSAGRSAAASPSLRPTSAASTSTASLDPPGEAATVIRVVDGDTIHARLNGVDEDVRIIGLDSPETSKPGTPVECFAREATAAAKRLLKPGDPILLQPDPTQDKRDRYDRLLAHVFLADGTLFAETMIRQGDAIHYVYDGVPSIHADQLAAAEACGEGRPGRPLVTDDVPRARSRGDERSVATSMPTDPRGRQIFCAYTHRFLLAEPARQRVDFCHDGQRSSTTPRRIAGNGPPADLQPQPRGHQARA